MPPDNRDQPTQFAADEASRSRHARPQAKLPGLWQAAFATVTAAGLVGGWAVPQAFPLVAGHASGTPSRLEEVAAPDLAGAGTTLSGSPATQAAFKQSDPVCGPHLAHVVLRSAVPGQATKVRIVSGKYVTPEFAITNSSVRVAIPFPAPYPAGKGVLRVLTVGSDVVAALSPAQHVLPVSADQAAIAVVWVPRPQCGVPGP